VKKLTPTLLSSTALVALGLLFNLPARAEDPPKPAEPAKAEEAPKPAPAVGSPEWTGDIKFGVQAQAGVVFNTNSPSNGLNFGQLFTDRSNQATLNQAAITLSRTIDPKTTGFDLGFKFQFLYGSDARYTHYLGVFDRAISSRYQIDITEANITMRLPIITEGGIDVKAGMYSTPMGLETIDPSTNPFYSHSYIFNFGLPLKHTGLYTVTHLNDVVDLHLGVDTGINTTFGSGNGDNNGRGAFLGGLGFNLMDGKLTVLALTHIGPENAVRAIGSIANDRNRYANDILITYKATDALTFTTEFNLIRDDYAKATAGGVAQYVGYAISDTWTLNGRAEIFRDDKNFFVAAFPTNLGPVQALGGYPAPIITAPGSNTTYAAFTVGGTWKPKVAEQISTLMIRPEVRYDQALTSNKPFSGRSNALTIAADLVIGF
jgi:hypothetical protein